MNYIKNYEGTKRDWNGRKKAEPAWKGSRQKDVEEKNGRKHRI